MSAAHTPGPWMVRGNKEKIVYAEGGSKKVARLNEYDDTANANLIAAAPDMLAALEAVTRMHATPDGHYRDNCGAMAQARVAIVKARGQGIGALLAERS